MGSHTATGEWQSFEIRMRRRRAERLVLRADVAVSEGCLDEARALLDEARTLWPSAPGLADVERSFDAAAHPVPDILSSDPTPRRWKEVAAAALCVGCVGAGATVLMTHAPTPLVARDEHAIVESVAAAPPQPISPSLAPASASVTNTNRSPDADADTDPNTDTTAATIPMPIAAIDSVRDALRTPSTIANPVTTTPPIPDRVRREAPRVEAPQPDTIAPTSGTLPPLLTAEPASAAASAPVPASAPAPVPAPATPPATATVERTVDRPDPAPAAIDATPSANALVRTALAGYAKAYSDLDVDAAARVWPTVDRSGLTRAFESLDSQQVSLGDCRIQVEGEAAHAQCAGVATWKPKVGSGERTDLRSWTFELEKVPAGWRIVSARVQNR